MRDSAIRAGMLACLVGLAMPGQPTNNVRPRIPRLEPPEKDFFSKSLDSHGIPIEAHEVVADEALYVAYDRLALMLTNLPMVTARLAAAYAEAGRFPEAVETAQRALQLAETQSNPALADAIRSQLKLYAAGLPFHQQSK